jgi:excinuclease ABC subunit C
MSRAIEALNKTFRLRDCSQKQVFRFADQLQLFDLEYRAECLRYELGTCLGPCAGACTHDAYRMNVNAAESFMDGFNDEPLVMVREQMELASTNLHYELAAQSRDTLKSLEYVHNKLGVLATVRRDYTFIYPTRGFDGCDTWYLIHSGEIVDAVRAPRSKDERRTMQSTLTRWQNMTANRLDRGHGTYAHTLYLIATWFKKNRDELKQTLTTSGDRMPRSRPSPKATSGF